MKGRFQMERLKTVKRIAKGRSVQTDKNDETLSGA